MTFPGINDRIVHSKNTREVLAAVDEMVNAGKIERTIIAGSR